MSFSPSNYTDTHDEEVMGRDGTLKWAFGSRKREINFTSVSWSRDVETTQIHHNDTLKPTTLTTALSFSGSFEYEGSNYELMYELMNDDQSVSGDLDAGEPPEGTLTLVETVNEDGTINKYLYTFQDVTITSISKDVSSDDASSVTVDWEADDMSPSSKTV